MRWRSVAPRGRCLVGVASPLGGDARAIVGQQARGLSLRGARAPCVGVASPLHEAAFRIRGPGRCLVGVASPLGGDARAIVGQQARGLSLRGFGNVASSLVYFLLHLVHLRIILDGGWSCVGLGKDSPEDD